MEDIDDTRAPLQASTPTHTPSTATGAPAEPTSQKTPSSPQPQRRKSGRAFRKSTGGPPSLPARPVNPDADPGPTPSAAPAPPSPGAKSVPPARVTRQRASQDQETPSKASPVRAVRRGRPPASAQKRSAPHTPVVTWNESPDKRRKIVASGDVANGVRPSPIVERVTRSGGRKEEESVEKLSTKAVTAIAVEAALASAKAVFKPLSDQLAALRTELENVSEAARRAADEIPLEASRKRRGKSGSSPVSAAADALQLDLSELLGGGEARIRAYANLSDNEFENFHKLIEDQRKGLKEFDRILQAAKELGKKAEKNAARDARAGRGRSRRG
ncbi:unnamed protein product [Chondrus crispus]|uniref:Uncharacterized protein n=1 Tax=Chondrus crispus TaxID=2769 RepID=R7Q6L3_CHOCR|nr:unnamed protein product [Chondrus crispus]CDF33105.1 unnamed protein product [Chondrus crispus]|eukprot:XP_005712908.1 unnamed protein product [Chondrus crispus]